ncbi:MAG: TIGR01459 family HAD-type hydrolase [Rhodobacteraceae bacterium]|uniref:HAD-superfamily class IIA hydrolase, TIGR01459 n=1 Tax=Salipiger thiooxidans TaxID=282683 RepID=A0A1G7BXT0_9RHOB|nr:TIGR01459 family HAD-type hydrolase [Salipiger thiooxidans]MAU46663.1 TIGR01459 family HAD-type hydrolase [Salipiger sp.]NVK62018.1 TIGR01459 family HAD-type hydrolase [Paracoccaceae bacterium]SDE30995.1 HAD-superfamily class IIA hydrolase, TIGR01459 [Salipiger thiooxidans]
MTRIIHALPEISNQYDAMFVDLWGCVHNGVEAYPDAIEALRAYRASGGVVVLVTNSPRSRKEVFKQIERFGVPEDAWDNIATSGDSARAAMFTGAVGNKVYFIGLEEERSFFEPLKIITDPVEIETVPLEEAEGIVCTGLFDATADPAAMRPQFLYAKQKGLKLLCANPDIVVDRGHRREWCAGALAALYTEMGGESLYFGKPHPPIYDLARRRLFEVAPDLDDPAILAIGDGVKTDILGAVGEDIDSLFITGGLAAEETATELHPHEELLLEFLAREGVTPTYSIGFLR